MKVVEQAGQVGVGDADAMVLDLNAKIRIALELRTDIDPALLT